MTRNGDKGERTKDRRCNRFCAAFPSCDCGRLTACERCDHMDDTLQQIVQWSEAYPLDVFPELSRDEWAKAAEVLKAAGITLDRISASNMRHVVLRVGEIAREGLR